MSDASQVVNDFAKSYATIADKCGQQLAKQLANDAVRAFILQESDGKNVAPRGGAMFEAAFDNMLASVELDKIEKILASGDTEEAKLKAIAKV